MSASQAFAEFARTLAFEDIPPEVVQRAKACMIDTIGDAIYGSRVAQGKIILDHVRRTSAPGNASIIGTAFKVQPPLAALANAAFSHAFELDSMCQPSVGSHPGAALTPSGLAIAQTKSASGKDLITAFVAGSEVMYRIGDAAHHSSEKLGFHAPGLLSVFGGIITAGRLMGLDTERITNALGIGGSLCAGLLEFTKSGGGMVKCLHLGHANEGALTALSLAESGFTGPPSVFEGKFGFLNVYCRDAEPGKMTADFGKVWRTLTITLKCFACHSTAHVAVIAALDLKAKHGIVGDNIASIRVAGSEKLISHHDIKEPQDIATAQYSANFSVALAFYRNPSDPDVFSTDSVNDPAIRALCRKVTLEPYAGISPTSLTSRVTIRLNDGREFTTDMQHFPGMPQQPFTEEQLWNKFSLVAKALPADRVRKLFDQLLALEKVSDVSKLEFV